MAAGSTIEWTDATWNPVRGCSRVSRGCGGPGKQGGCYAEVMAARFSKPGLWGHGFAEMKNGEHRWTGKVALIEDQLTLPLTWKKPRRIFVNSTSDLFHEALPDEALDRIFAIMALCPQHTFQVLTKRPERMRGYCASDATLGRVAASAAARSRGGHFVLNHIADGFSGLVLPNVWLGTSCEDQATADERIPVLLDTPAAIRFVSLEPLLGAINIKPWLDVDARTGTADDGPFNILDWVIIGGESGKGARVHDLQWSRRLIAQCKAAGVAVFEKQLGSAPVGRDDRITHRGYDGLMPQGFNRYLKHSKGGDWSEWPDDLRVREWPQVPA